MLFFFVHTRLRKATHKINALWTLQYESSVSEVWAYILKRQDCAVVARNILTHADAVRRFQSIDSCLRMAL
jgi:hypothetical protein